MSTYIPGGSASTDGAGAYNPAPVQQVQARRLHETLNDRSLTQTFQEMRIAEMSDIELANLYFGEGPTLTERTSNAPFRLGHEIYAGHVQQMHNIGIAQLTADDFPIFSHCFHVEEVGLLQGYQANMWTFQNYTAETLPHAAVPKTVAHKSVGYYHAFTRFGMGVSMEWETLRTPIGAQIYALSLKQVAYAMFTYREMMCIHALFVAFQNRDRYVSDRFITAHPDPLMSSYQLVLASNMGVAAAHKGEDVLGALIQDSKSMVQGANTLVVTKGMAASINSAVRDRVDRPLLGAWQPYFMEDPSGFTQELKVLNGLAVLEGPEFYLHDTDRAENPLQRERVGLSIFTTPKMTDLAAQKVYETENSSLLNIQDQGFKERNVGIRMALRHSGRFRHMAASLLHKDSDLDLLLPLSADAAERQKEENVFQSMLISHEHKNEDVANPQFFVRVDGFVTNDGANYYTSKKTDIQKQLDSYQAPSQTKETRGVNPNTYRRDGTPVVTARSVSFEHLCGKANKKTWMQTVGGFYKAYGARFRSLISHTYRHLRTTFGTRDKDEILGHLFGDDTQLYRSLVSIKTVEVNKETAVNVDDNNFLDIIPLCIEQIEAFATHNIPQCFGFGLFQYQHYRMGCMFIMKVSPSFKYYLGKNTWKVNMDDQNWNIFGFCAETGGAFVTTPNDVYYQGDVVITGYLGGIEAHPFDLSQKWRDHKTIKYPKQTYAVVLLPDHEDKPIMDIRGKLPPKMSRVIGPAHYFDPTFVTQTIGFESNLHESSDDQIIAQKFDERAKDPRQIVSLKTSTVQTLGAMGTCEKYSVQKKTHVLVTGNDFYGNMGTNDQRQQCCLGRAVAFSTLSKTQIEATGH